MLRQVLKRLFALLPHPVDAHLSDFARFLGSPRYRWQQRVTRRALGQLAYPRVVISGPFAGMKYPVRSGAQGGLIPKLVGSYEKELNLVVEELIRVAPALFIDVGAADGYYAVGFACRIPQARVIAYEQEKPLRGVIRTVAQANGVEDRISVRGICTAEALRSVLEEARTDRTLSPCAIIVDVEGYEDTLFDTSLIPLLTQFLIVCEIHERISPGVGARLRAKFDLTHTIRSITSQQRGIDDVPAGLKIDDPESVLDEGRTDAMDWFVIRPRNATTEWDVSPAVPVA